MRPDQIRAAAAAYDDARAESRACAPCGDPDCDMCDPAEPADLYDAALRMGRGEVTVRRGRIRVRGEGR